MMNLLVRGGAVLFWALCGAQCGQIYDKYLKIPQVYEYDDFYTCRRRYTNFVYCVSVTTLQPDASNDLWKNISHLLSNRRNFPHDQLERGLCINDYFDEILDDNIPKEIDTHVSTKILNQYELNSHTKTNACWTSADFERKTTFGEYFFVFISTLLCAITLLATWKDYNGCTNDSTVIQSFSIRKNMQHLWGAPKPNALAFLDGMRALGTLIILIVHSQLPMIRMPVRNTEDLEAQANHFIFPLINSGNTHMIQFFFTLGGMVFGTSCLKHFERFPSSNFMYFVEKMLRRFVRTDRPWLNTRWDVGWGSFPCPDFMHLIPGGPGMGLFRMCLAAVVGLPETFPATVEMRSIASLHFALKYFSLYAVIMKKLLPPYMLIILYQATWYKRVKQGPLEFKFNDYCSEHWWTNLLFVNNYVHPTKPCLQFSWYLGADFQLFLIGSSLLMMLWKYPFIKTYLTNAMVLVALFMPGYIIFTASTEATMTFDMRHALAELRTYDHFLKYYLPSHTNISSYFFGIIAAMVNTSTLNTNSQHLIQPWPQRWFIISLIALLSLNAFTTLLPFVNISNENSIFHATYGSLLKCSWGCSFSLLFLVFAMKSKSTILDVLSHSSLHFLAKISYCVYIVQYSVIYGLYTNFPIPIIYGGFNMLFLTSAILILTLICAVLLHLAVEAPIMHIGNKYVTLLLAYNDNLANASEKRTKQL